MPGSLARRSLLNALSGAATTLGGVLSTILVARMLGVEGTGVVGVATWVITLALILSDMGLPGSLVRFLPELHAHGELEQARALLRLLFRRQIVIVVLLCALFLGVAAELALRSPTPGVRLDGDQYWTSSVFWGLVALGALSQALGAYFYSYLRGMQRFGRLMQLTTISAVLQLMTTLIGSKYLGVAGALTAAAAVAIIPACLAFTIRGEKRPVDGELNRRVTRYALESWAAYLATFFIWSRFEILFLERSWGSEAVGLFAVSLTVANLAVQGPILLTGAFLPYLAQLVGEGSHERKAQAYRTALRLMGFLVFPLALGLAAVIPVLLPLVYGTGFKPAVPICIVLLIAAPLSGIVSIVISFLFALDQARVLYIAGAIGAMLATVAGVTVISAYGPIGAAFSRAGIQVCIVLICFAYVERRLNVQTPLSSLSRAFAAAALCAVAAWACLQFVDGVGGLLVAIPLGAVVYFLLARLFRVLLEEDVERLATVAGLFPRPFRQVAVAAAWGLCPRG